MIMPYNLPTVRINPGKNEKQKVIHEALMIMDGSISDIMREILYKGSTQILSERSGSLPESKKSSSDVKEVGLNLSTDNNIVDDLLGDFE